MEDESFHSSCVFIPCLLEGCCTIVLDRISSVSIVLSDLVLFLDVEMSFLIKVRWIESVLGLKILCRPGSKVLDHADTS